MGVFLSVWESEVDNQFESSCCVVISSIKVEIGGSAHEKVKGLFYKIGGQIMKGSYAIAYSDKEGRDFCDSKPWILDDFSNKADCLSETMRLIKDGFKM